MMRSTISDEKVRAVGTQPDSTDQLRWLEEYRNGGPDACEALERLVASFDGIVRRLANKIARQGGADREDLVSDGKVGLLCALKSFKNSKGIKISTYYIFP